MSFNTQEFAAIGQAQLEKAVRFSSIVLAGAERIAALQLELSRKALADSAQSFKSFSEVKDIKSFGEWQSNISQPGLDQAFGTARTVYDAAVSTQNEIVAFVEEQVAEINKSVLGNIDRLAKNAPAGSDIAVNALKTIIDSSNSAFESVSKTAQKISADLAEVGVEAASNSAKAASATVSRPTAAASTARKAAAASTTSSQG